MSAEIGVSMMREKGLELRGADMGAGAPCGSDTGINKSVSGRFAVDNH